MSDAAIRANRRGRVAVAAELVDDAKAWLGEHVSLISFEPDPARRCVWLHGYSDQFDALPLGAAAPEYRAILQIVDNREVLLLRFERIGPFTGLSI
jgi:hypothetical protein